MMYQQFPQILYLSQCVPFSVLLCCREATFFRYQIVHGLPPHHFSHPDFLECWCLGHVTALSVSA